MRLLGFFLNSSLFLLLFCFFISTVGCSKATKSSHFQLRLSEKGLSRLGAILAPFLDTQVAGTKIPEYDGVAPSDIPLTYNCSNIVVQKLDCAPLLAYFSEGRGINVKAQIAPVITLDWSYRAKLGVTVTGHGSATDTMQISLAMNVIPGDNDPKGTLEFSVQNVQAEVTDVDIKVSGAESWVYQIIVDVIENNIIKNKMSSIVADALKTSLASGLNSLVSNAEMKFELDQDLGLYLDYRLVSNPIIYSESVLASLSGVFSLKSSSACPKGPNTLPISSNPPASPLNLLIDEYMGDCLCYLLYKNGVFAATLHRNQLPKASPIQLYTSDPNTKALFPSLYQLYPDDDMWISITATGPPSLSFAGDGAKYPLSLHSKFNVSVFVIDGNETNHLAFVVGLQLDIIMDPQLTSTQLSLEVQNVLNNATVLSSNVGPISGQNVRDVTNLLVSMGVIPQLQQWARENSFPMPKISGFTFVNPFIYYHPGYLQIATDFAGAL